MVKINGREIKRPTVVCDTDDYVVLKIGEYEDMLGYYKVLISSLNQLDYKSLNRYFQSMGLPALSKPLERSIELIELPLDQEVVDNVFYNSGCLANFIGESKESNVIKINFESIE